jgi:hypothetical protein
MTQETGLYMVLQKINIKQKENWNAMSNIKVFCPTVALEIFAI